MLEKVMTAISGVEAGTTIAANVKSLFLTNTPNKKPAKVRLRFPESNQTLLLVNVGDTEATNIQVCMTEGEWQSPFDDELLMRLDAGESIEKKVFFSDYSLGDADFCVNWSDAETGEEYEDHY